MSGADEHAGGRFVFSARYIANQIDRASVRTTLTYRFLPGLTAGVEYNPRARRAGPLVNWLALRETASRPALILGTSSDRIGTPSGQSYYATFSKSLRRETGLPIAPYGGAAYSTYQHRWRPIGGLNVGITEQWSLLGIFDGVHAHGLVNFSWSRHTWSLIMVRGRDPGVSYSVGF